MKYSLLIEDRFRARKIHECAQNTTRVSYVTQRTGAPGVLKFTVLKGGEIAFFEGDPVRFSVDDTLVFYGFVFTKVKNQWGEIEVTCYDQLRYLKATQSYLFEGMTATAIVRRIASDFSLVMGDICDTGYVIPSYVCENKGCLDIIGGALAQTAAATGIHHTLLDDGGRLAVWQSPHILASVMIGSGAGLTEYNYTTDIDSETYNCIKLVRPNAATGKMDVFVAKSDRTIEKWGQLHYYEQVDKDLNEAQIREQAESLLKGYNRTLRILRFTTLGILGLRAGHSIVVSLPDLGDISLQKSVVLESAAHVFTQDSHMMTLETRITDGID